MGGVGVRRKARPTAASGPGPLLQPLCLEQQHQRPDSWLTAGTRCRPRLDDVTRTWDAPVGPWPGSSQPSLGQAHHSCGVSTCAAKSSPGALRTHPPSWQMRQPHTRDPQGGVQGPPCTKECPRHRACGWWGQLKDPGLHTPNSEKWGMSTGAWGREACLGTAFQNFPRHGHTKPRLRAPVVMPLLGTQPTLTHAG